MRRSIRSATTGEHLAHILVTLQCGAMDRVRGLRLLIAWAHGRRVIGRELTEGSGLAAGSFFEPQVMKSPQSRP